MGKKVISAGHICLDITPVFPEKQYTKVEEILKPGKLIQMEKADVHIGGSVGNTGIAMKILGADVSLVARTGDDIFGKIVLSSMNKYGADEAMRVVHGGTTAHSAILAIPGIDRIFLHHPGVNDTFSEEDISEESLKEVTLFHLGYPSVMKKLYENEGEGLLNLLKKVKKQGIVISVDMAAVDENSSASKENWKNILQKTIPYIDIFMPSVEELCYMLDKARLEEWKERAEGGDITEILDIYQDVCPLAEKCFQMGAKILVIKCGVRGMYYCTTEAAGMSEICNILDLDVSEWSGQEGFEESYQPERFLSGTGAGDTSIAAFLTALLKKYSLKECMQLATATGASCVAAYDALSGLKSFDELERKIKAGWPKVNMQRKGEK